MTIKQQPIEIDDDVLKDFDYSHQHLVAKPAVEKTVDTADNAGAQAEPIAIIGPAERPLPGSSAYVERPNLIDGYDDFHDIRETEVQRDPTFAEKQALKEIDALEFGHEGEADPTLLVVEPAAERAIKIEIGHTVDVVVGMAEEKVTVPAEVVPLPVPFVSGLPEGFSSKADGIYVVVKPEKPDGEYDEQFLCSPLRVIDLFRQRDGLVWGRRVVVTNREGGKTTFPVLDEDLELKGRAFLAQLSGRGLRFGKVKRAREIVLELLKDWSPDKMMLSTKR